MPQFYVTKSPSLLKLSGIGFVSLAIKRFLVKIDVYKKQSPFSTLICLVQKNEFDVEIKQDILVTCALVS